VIIPRKTLPATHRQKLNVKLSMYAAAAVCAANVVPQINAAINSIKLPFKFFILLKLQFPLTFFQGIKQRLRLNLRSFDFPHNIYYYTATKQFSQQKAGICIFIDITYRAKNPQESFCALLWILIIHINQSAFFALTA
jgi:hypothetical protein